MDGRKWNNEERAVKRTYMAKFVVMQVCFIVTSGVNLHSKFLKAVIEGGVETKPDNILIYATSNRRHLIKETWSDRSDVKVQNGMHQSDTMEEKLSLVNRFGVTINYSKPSQKEYFNIVIELAHRQGITMSDDELRAEANKWELSHGGISGRTAQQFVNYLAGFEEHLK